MKHFLFTSLFTFFVFISTTGQDLIMTGIIDGPLSGGTPKAIEFVALQDIPDLSRYGIGSASNGGGTDGEEFTFPASETITKGTFIYVSREETEFNTWFGFLPDHMDSVAIFNGDDAIEIFFDGTVYDVYGNVDVDGTNQAWEYEDGWAYRKNNTGFSTPFNPNGWTYSGVGALTGEATNSQADTPFPTASYDVSVLSVDDIHNVITLTPNPVSEGNVYLKGLPKPVKVSLYNLSGQLIQEQITSELLDVRGVSIGLYLVRIHHPRLVLTRKLVIE
jgi:hypothetical protein